MAKNQTKKDALFFRLSRHMLILRRNLMASSALILMVLLFDVEIKPDQILGGAITGLTEWEIHCAAFILLFYFMGHFIWSHVNELREWWLLEIMRSGDLENSILEGHRELEEHREVIEKSWKFELLFFELGPPIVMGVWAMGWLGYLIIA